MNKRGKVSTGKEKARLHLESSKAGYYPESPERSGLVLTQPRLPIDTKAVKGLGGRKGDVTLNLAGPGPTRSIASFTSSSRPPARNPKVSPPTNSWGERRGEYRKKFKTVREIVPRVRQTLLNGSTAGAILAQSRSPKSLLTSRR